MVGAGKAVNSLARGASHLSKRLILSYVFDWIVILVVAAIGGIFSKIHGNKHDFNLYDPAISFPYKAKDTVSSGVLIAVGLAAPAVITALVSLLLVPGPTARKSTPKPLIWRRKLWELNTAWMGLGVALASTLFFTEGLKDLTGKPRPDLLARCQPDLSAASLQKYRVGGLNRFLSEAALIVDWQICRNTDMAVLRDGFASWPSGHSSFSWAGMLYLSLWLCAKFAISIPFLAPTPYARSGVSTFEDDSATPEGLKNTIVPARNQAAAPPTYLLVIGFVPIGTALFICLSRWADYRHHGFDIISGALLGAFFGWLGFRWYHLPIQTGSGWSWGARSRDRAFGIGIGMQSYVGDEGWHSSKKPTPQAIDLESQQHAVTGPGLEDTRESSALGGGLDGQEFPASGHQAQHRTTEEI